MKSLIKLVWLIPLFVIIIELFAMATSKQIAYLDPSSDKNEYLTSLKNILNKADIPISQISINSYQNEIEFLVRNQNSSPTKVIISSNKNALYQVNALQKLIKIANIKEKQIKFIDLSSRRPYATL